MSDNELLQAILEELRQANLFLEEISTKLNDKPTFRHGEDTVGLLNQISFNTLPR